MQFDFYLGPLHMYVIAVKLTHHSLTFSLSAHVGLFAGSKGERSFSDTL